MHGPVVFWLCHLRIPALHLRPGDMEGLRAGLAHGCPGASGAHQSPTKITWDTPGILKAGSSPIAAWGTGTAHAVPVPLGFCSVCPAWPVSSWKSRSVLLSWGVLNRMILDQGRFPGLLSSAAIVRPCKIPGKQMIPDEAARGQDASQTSSVNFRS